MLVHQLEELSAQHRSELREQYMRIHEELGDEVFHLKREHRIATAEWQVGLISAYLQFHPYPYTLLRVTGKQYQSILGVIGTITSRSNYTDC